MSAASTPGTSRTSTTRRFSTRAYTSSSTPGSFSRPSFSGAWSSTPSRSARRSAMARDYRIPSFSSRLLYTAYAGISETSVFDMDRVTDQRVGGAIMWVVGDFVFLAAASVAFFLWLAEEEEMQKRRERIASR